jgi:hypothetical protein
MIESQPMPRFLTPGEAADLLRVSRRTVYNCLRAGQLPAIRVVIWAGLPEPAQSCGDNELDSLLGRMQSLVARAGMKAA